MAPKKSITELIHQLIIGQGQATPAQLAHLVRHVVTVPFTAELLEVDEPLWGGFWQGDVIAPGYRLPAVELALLRASRLDGTWPEGTPVAQFLADLRQAMAHTSAGLWTLVVAGQPCVVLAAESHPPSAIRHPPSAIRHPPWLTVAWYCVTTDRLHAGYRVVNGSLKLKGALEQRRPIFMSQPTLASQPSWLEQVVEPVTEAKPEDAMNGEPGDQENELNFPTIAPFLAARLDAEILRIRLTG